MKKIHKFIILFLTTWVLNSCNKLSDFGDINVNPAATTNPDIAALLTNVQSGLGGYALNTTPGYYCQYFSETQYSSASLYASNQAEFSGVYAGDLYDLQNIINTNKSKSMSAVASILQQYIYWTLTDRWGDIPYSQALKGVEFTKPVYDTQESVFKGMIAALKTANTTFDGSAITGDIVYGGNVDSWKRFANTLRMMMALELSKKYPGANDYAATEFKAALNDGVITTNSQNFQLNFPGGSFSSTYWGVYNGRKDLAESQTMTNMMAALEDNRQNAFGGATEQAGLSNSNSPSNIGVPYGIARDKAEAFTNANPNWARVLIGSLRQATSPVFILTAAQATLARVEAADYGWTTESLSTLYTNGIKLSYEQWGLPAPSSTYLEQNSVKLNAPAGTGANLKNIATQRYVASYPDGLQGWNIWRKTGYPELKPAPDAVSTSKAIPHRFVYGTGEYSSNKANVDAAVAKVPGYSQDSKIWWE